MKHSRELGWREARSVLTAAGLGVNEAQQVLDDLAHFPDRRRSINVEGEIWWLRFSTDTLAPYVMDQYNRQEFQS